MLSSGLQNRPIVEIGPISMLLWAELSGNYWPAEILVKGSVPTCCVYFSKYSPHSLWSDLALHDMLNTCSN